MDVVINLTIAGAVAAGVAIVACLAYVAYAVYRGAATAATVELRLADVVDLSQYRTSS